MPLHPLSQTQEFQRKAFPSTLPQTPPSLHVSHKPNPDCLRRFSPTRSLQGQAHLAHGMRLARLALQRVVLVRVVRVVQRPTAGQLANVLLHMTIRVISLRAIRF